MSLIDEAKELCTLLDRRSVPDGQAGFRPQWIDGAQFYARSIPIWRGRSSIPC